MTIPGSGALSPQERVLTARVHTAVALTPGTWMVKVLPPPVVRRYLAGEVSAGRPGSVPPFDYRLVGGTVARHQDCANLRSAGEAIHAFRLDYPGSPFAANQPLCVLEFPVLDPHQFLVPFGAPWIPNVARADVSIAAQAMLDGVKLAGVDPNTYRLEIAPWPFTGTGLTGGGDLAVPEWWKRPGIVPMGSRIVVDGAVTAVYRGADTGWEATR
ncbi:hypothetical protein [Actinokineospora sp. HUAS TT18]|uniref:hypothetical protein n=1 Tax=Actinokineospora sp. HUAS TT18 TaxID=3447451 RepID=UPI003F52721A